MKLCLFLITLCLSTWGISATEIKEVYEYCEEIPSNMAITVKIPDHKSKSTSQSYTFMKASENVYDVYLNMEFSALKSYDGHVKKEKLNTYFKTYVNTCFKEIENKLVDEYGRKIRLNLYDSKSSKLPSPPPLINVGIKSAKTRPTKTEYTLKMPCKTVVHESLHLLGLVDEYPEKKDAYNNSLIGLATNRFVSVSEKNLPAFDCRALGPKDSFMRDQDKLYSGHINAIIYPNCEKKNKKYFGCTRFTFKTSVENNGGYPNIIDCKKQVPEYCKDPAWVKVDDLPKQVLQSSPASVSCM